MGNESGRATDIDRLLVYPGLPTPILTLTENDDFWGCPTDFWSKFRQKNGDNFEFSWISRQDRVGFPNCLDLHIHCCATVNAANF